MQKPDLIFILKSLIFWRILLVVLFFFAVKILPLQRDFLGGGMANYLANPYIWSWANFDGEHYLAIARDGYLPLTYFFFPLYPILIRITSMIFGSSLFGYLLSGLFVSHLSLLLGTIGFYKLLRLDLSEKISKLSLIMLLLFPTSFYLGSVYTESLFFALAVWSFLMARKRNWLFAGIFAGFATATRIIGIALVAGLLIEWWQYSKTVRIRRAIYYSFFCILISLFGLGSYLYYLYTKTGDPLNFLTTVSIFGTQRSSSFIILPQVFYRYIFKILPSLNYGVFLSMFTPFLELVVALFFTILSVLSFFKLRLSYSVFLLLGFLIPTLSGSFSSLPRYVLILFPAFILGGIYLNIFGKWRYLVLGILSLGLFICTILFTRGYWIS